MFSTFSHAAFQVTDLEGSIDHATTVLGMRELGRRDDSVFLTHGPDLPSLELRPGAVTALDHTALQLRDPAAIVELRQALDAHGTAWAAGPDEPGIAESVRFEVPEGHLIEAVLPAIDEAPAWALQGQPPYVPSGVRPRQVGHINLTSEDVASTVEFFTAVLGFATSDVCVDEAGEVQLAFLRCGSLHHSIAVLGGANGMFHYAFEVDTVQDLVRLGDLLDIVDRRFLWGPGRHAAGDNIATYHPDPSGVLYEVYAEMQQIDDDRWEPRRWSMTDDRVANMWGAAADPGKLLATSIPLVAEGAQIGS